MILGRLNGVEIVRFEWVVEGKVFLYILRVDIDYVVVIVYIIYGVLGIKVWIFYGEVFFSKKEGGEV